MISRSDLISTAESTSTRMLGPSAYSEALLPSLRLARSSRSARRIGKVLLAMLVVGFFLVTVAPWQQSVTGAGNVIAYAPLERQQTIEVPIEGRVARWGENIVENAHVTKGQLIAEVQDIDPDLMERLQDQLKATDAQLTASRFMLAASERNRDAALNIVTSQQALLRSYQLAKEQILAAATAAIDAAESKVEAERKERDEVQAALTQFEYDFARQQKLFKERVVAESKLQMAERKFKEAKAKFSKAQAYVEQAQSGLIEKQRDRDAKEQKAQGEIDYATAMLDKAKGDVAKSESDVGKARAEVSKSEKLLSQMETKVARQQSQEIRAPFDGFLTKINANQGSQILKKGDTLCVIVPDTSDRAVQVLLDGNDAPLVEAGRHVRLQFEGWPAVQFAGWPSVAVGTFGGTVVSIDATDNGKGKFRVLVRPDADSLEWPDDRYLRQGVRANAWVLLERVPLWYEVWRNMNGFPPVVEQDEDKSKAKKPKLPK